VPGQDDEQHSQREDSRYGKLDGQIRQVARGNEVGRHKREIGPDGDKRENHRKIARRKRLFRRHYNACCCDVMPWMRG